MPERVEIVDDVKEVVAGRAPVEWRPERVLARASGDAAEDGVVGAHRGVHPPVEGAERAEAAEESLPQRRRAGLSTEILAIASLWTTPMVLART
jgi:hypothetical protein